METAKEFVERLPWMSINGKPDFDQWENHLKHRDALIRADERQKAAGWKTAKEPPESGKFVLCAIAGKKLPIRAFYAAPHTEEGSSDDDFSEYDEEKDEYYLPTGWYEANEYEECHWFVHDVVTGWMPLPEPPAIMAEPEEAQE